MEIPMPPPAKIDKATHLLSQTLIKRAIPPPAAETKRAIPHTERPPTPLEPPEPKRDISQTVMPHERAMFMASEGNVLIKLITATHSPDGREINVRPILQIAQDILNSSTMTSSDSTLGSKSEALQEKPNTDALATMVENLSYIINRLSCEISYKCMDVGDGHSTTLSLLNLLSNYSWEAKLVLTLAAFALNYGDFWLLAQIHTTNKLANRMAILKQLPFFLDSTPSKRLFDALKELIQSVLILTRCIVQFTELPKVYFSQDNSEYSTAVASFPLATYWIFRSATACATNIAYLSGMRHEYMISATETWELSSLTFKIKNISEDLQKQLAICQQYAEEKIHIETYLNLLRRFDAVHIDNMEVLKLLFHHRDDPLPLFDGVTNKQVSLDVLRSKRVLLLISSLDISGEEIVVLDAIFQESRRKNVESQYEVVWFPVVDRSTQWTDSNQEKFESLRNKMSWYSVHNPSLIDAAVIRFFKENLHFNRKAILVTLDPQGKIVCPNALHMIWIWQNIAYPFTKSREEALWKEETWRLQFLVDGIDPNILEWIRERNPIILFGSDDTEWIRKLTKAAGDAARLANLPIRTVYVGNSNLKSEKIRKAMQAIDAEKLCNLWKDPTLMWFFWARVESMIFSKIELRRNDEEKDNILHEVKKLLSYEKTGSSWALFSEGSKVILCGYGDTVLSALLECDKWKKDAKSFGSAFKDYYLEKLGDLASHPCCQLEFSSTRLDYMKCPECGRSMQKFLPFHAAMNNIA